MIKRDCKHCDKVFEGYTEKQLDNMEANHVRAKHSDLEKKEMKGGKN